MNKMLTIEQAAEPLNLTPKAIRLKIARHQLPFVKLGRLVRIPEDELRKYLAALHGCTADEALSKIEEKAA